MRKSLRQDFILVDSICGDLTLEDGGDPVRQDRLIAAADPVLSDTYGCSILGLDPAQVPYIGIAESAGAGSSDLRNAVIRKYVYESACDAAGRQRNGSRILQCMLRLPYPCTGRAAEGRTSGKTERKDRDRPEISRKERRTGNRKLYQPFPAFSSGLSSD